MNKKILGLFIFILLTLVLISPVAVLAVGGGLDPDTGEPNVPTGEDGGGDEGGGGFTITGMVDGAVQTTLYIASGIVVILWIVTGLLFLTAQGAPEKLSSAKKALFASVAGTVLVIIASSAISLVKSAFKI